MFTQGDRVSGRLKEGLGLGLTLVKSLVEMHGGTVGVTSLATARGASSPSGSRSCRGMRKRSRYKSHRRLPSRVGSSPDEDPDRR